MSIKTGRYGEVMYDSGPASPTNPTIVGALNSWKLSETKDYEDVTCFLDTNKVYVPGLPDISGSVSGFWDSTITVLFSAAKASTPGYLKLMPNNTESSFTWEGLAYLDASIDCSLQAPKVSGNFKAAGPWITPGA